jgi:SAM-dependent methyltransferase
LNTYRALVANSNKIYDLAISSGSDEKSRVLCTDLYRMNYRFSEIASLIGDISISKLSILDLGCGNGELIPALNSLGFRGKYLGVDINRGLIEEARKRFPKYEFRELNILEESVPIHDITVISGVFNLDFGQDKKFLQSFLLKAFSFSAEKLIFNAISTYVNRRDPGFFYLSPEDAVDLAASISHRFTLRHGFLPFNYTVGIYNDSSAWESLNAK